MGSPYPIYTAKSIRERLKDLRKLAKQLELHHYSSYRHTMRLIEHWEVELKNAEAREKKA